MINFSMNTRIHRSLEQVFRFVTTPENDFQWQYGTFASARIPRDIPDTRTFFRSIGHLMGRRNLSTFEVTEYEPNMKYGFKSISGPLDSETAYVFEIADGGTKITVSTQASVLHFFQVDEGILEKRMKKQLKENLETLKDLLEERQMLPASETASPPGEA